MRKAALFSLVLLALPWPLRRASRRPSRPWWSSSTRPRAAPPAARPTPMSPSWPSKPGVLALTFSVDYWDYLGWADTFAKPEFAERQKAYVAKLALREPYTPQVVVDGRAQAPGSKTERVDKLVAEAAQGAARSAGHPLRRATGASMSGSGPRAQGRRRGLADPLRPARAGRRGQERRQQGPDHRRRRTWCASCRAWAPGAAGPWPSACPRRRRTG